MEKSMISLCLLGGLAIGNGFAQTPSKPNILLIIADDCSYYDIGCFRSGQQQDSPYRCIGPTGDKVQQCV
mgnify:CR=1 FL=1